MNKHQYFLNSPPPEEPNTQPGLRTSGFVQLTLIPPARKRSPEYLSDLSKDTTVSQQGRQ